MIPGEGIAMPIHPELRPLYPPHWPELSSHACDPAWKIGSDAILMTCGLRTSDHAGFEKVELSAPVHLALDELEFGDLTLSLSVGPRK
jgi:hypothetical protein